MLWFVIELCQCNKPQVHHKGPSAAIWRVHGLRYCQKPLQPRLSLAMMLKTSAKFKVSFLKSKEIRVTLDETLFSSL